MSSTTQAADSKIPEHFSAERYLTERLKDQIDWYDRKSQFNQRWYKRLQVVQIAAAAAIPFLVGVLPEEGLLVKIIVGGLGLGVAVAAGVQMLYRFQEHWVEYRTVCESLKHEQFLYLTGTPPYDNADEAFHKLVLHVERHISQEHSRWIAEMRDQERDAIPSASSGSGFSASAAVNDT